MTEPAVTKTIGKCRKPGFLLEPLGWVPARLSKAIEIEPCLIELLFDLDPARMHLMALALAHLASDVPPDLALMLLKGVRKPILNLSLGHHRPFGIDRALHHLPPKVLSAETYRKLVDLLNDPVTAKFLHHRQLITEKMIAGLATLPADLRRPAILAMFGRVDGMDRFVDGLRCLAAHARMPGNSALSFSERVEVAARLLRERRTPLDHLRAITERVAVPVILWRLIGTTAHYSQPPGPRHALRDSRITFPL